MSTSPHPVIYFPSRRQHHIRILRCSRWQRVCYGQNGSVQPNPERRIHVNRYEVHQDRSPHHLISIPSISLPSIPPMISRSHIPRSRSFRASVYPFQPNNERSMMLEILAMNLLFLPSPQLLTIEFLPLPHSKLMFNDMPLSATFRN